MRRPRHHIYALVLATLSFLACATLRADGPAETKPAGIVQELNDARLKLFDWVRTKGWVDANVTVSRPKGEGDGNGNGNGNGSNFGSGSGNGNGGAGGKGNGNGSGSGNSSGSASSGSGSGNGSDSANRAPASGGGEEPPVNDPGPGVISSSGASKAFKVWYPMCLFVDPNASDEANTNAVIKGLVDQAAACDVNLVVFPITVSPSGYAKGDPETTNNQQKAACNLLPLDNATRASTSICVDDTQMADKMCKSTCVYDAKNPDPDCGTNNFKFSTGGCAQVQSGQDGKERVRRFRDGLDVKIAAGIAENKKDSPDKAIIAAGEQAQKRKDEIKEDGSFEGGAPSTSGVAPSIEDKKSCDAGTVGHEALGHSQFGFPNGKTAGNGIGLNDDPGKVPESGGWTPQEGCVAMRANAFANSGKWKWDPNRTTYYTEIKDPSKQWDFKSGKTVMGPRNGPPVAGPVTPREPGTPPGRVTFDDTVSKARPKPVEDSKPPQTPTGTPEKEVAGPTGKHKGQQPGSVAGELVQNLKEAAEPPSDPKSGEQPPGSDVFVRSAPGPSSSGGSSARVTFDDGAKKGGGKYTDYGTSGRVSNFGNSTVGGSRSTASVSFDDGAKKGGGGSTNYGGGGGSSEGGEGTSIANEGSVIKVNRAGAGIASQLDGNFFNELGQAEQQRQQAEAARERRPAVVQEGGSRRTSADKRAIVR